MKDIPIANLAKATSQKPDPVKKAIILVAGIGKRLRPFTDRLPKCLAPVNGVPILINTLRQLNSAGIKEVVIVVGHYKEKIRERVKDSFGGMQVTYVESEVYDKTNNVYSLWLAREHMTQDVLLLEGDVFFDKQLIDRMLATNGNIAAVASYQSFMSGTVVRVDSEDNIEEMTDANHQGPGFDYSNAFKTVNIWLFRGDFLRDYFLPKLEATIASGEVNGYYESILTDLDYLPQHELLGVRCDGVKWYEIDDENDRLAAEYMFSSQEERFDFISGQHGSYWRYGFVDHAYLYNLYYPPKEMFAHFEKHIRELVLNYPVGQDMLAQLMGGLIDQPAERIVVGNGASEFIKIISGTLGKKMIVPVPSFNEYVNAAPKGQVVEFALEAPSFHLDVDKFAAEAEQQGAEIAVVVSPNNPTSLVVPKQDVVRLAKRLADQRCMLVLDESFIDFASNNSSITLVHDLEQHPNLAIIKSLSKSYGIGGLRLGYLLTANRELLGQVRGGIHIWNINGFAEAFLRIAPRYRCEFIQSCECVRADRDNLHDGLCAIPGMTVYKPDANFVFCRLPNSSATGPEVTRALFLQDNIYIKHCAGKSLDEADRYLRIAARTSTENDRLVKALGRIIGSSAAVATRRVSSTVDHRQTTSHSPLSRLP
ncbi:MAG: aminotransferase class I/II-fold pyridoxal phosphate-dependent enzyme [Proteobacteria bacterium]|nr:aminotransferase class I/II-fold pyridoxal phosphate-dependent enzyme [Pseudomonadota bacterium]